jgi:hypothetical protein
MSFIETPDVSGGRSITHAVLFLTFLHLGFIRKWKRGELPPNNSKKCFPRF